MRLGHSLLFEIGALPYALLTMQRAWRDHGGQLAELACIEPGDRVLDLGCGPGESAFGMLDRVPGAEVVGVDLSALMVGLARMRSPRNRGKARFHHGDAMNLDFADASFDAVTGHSFLYLVRDSTRVLSEVRRVLRPGGRCVFLEPAAATDAPFLPAELGRRARREPRFVTSMALWRIVSRRYGRFDSERFAREFAVAGLSHVETRETLGGIGLFGIARA